jgi:pimeloyl-ACP methyl ester carboxylesterase
MTSAARGRLIDIGGRRLRLVEAGPPVDGPQTATPTVLLEAGAFGFSADWAVVQQKLADLGIRSLAYDRAGMGRSDPGPAPRDGHTVLGDLERLLTAAGEAPPYILVGHSMAGLRVQLFSARHPDWVRGVVLVDAGTPQATENPLGRAYLGLFVALSRFAALAAGLGLIKPFAWMGDRIGLQGAARREKEWAYAHAPHVRTAAAEVDQWLAAADQARGAGGYDQRIPVAVVTAGQAPDGHPLKVMMSAPALAAGRSYVRHVRGARHATLLGRRFADEIARAVLWVRGQ